MTLQAERAGVSSDVECVDVQDAVAAPKPPRPRGWSRRWVQAVQAVGCVGRISRGRAGHKAGHVLAHTVGAGRITARVQGFDVSFTVDTFDDLQWRRVVERLRQRPLYTARLLAGEVPPEIETVFADAGLALVPQRGMAAACTCPSAETSCAHVAAVAYAAGEVFEADPFLLFTLRGRTRDLLQSALRGASRVDSAPPVDPRSFWTAAPPDALHVDVSAPHAPHAALTRLGAPAEWCSGDDLARVVSPALDAVARKAARVLGG